MPSWVYNSSNNQFISTSLLYCSLEKPTATLQLISVIVPKSFVLCFSHSFVQCRFVNSVLCLWFRSKLFPCRNFDVDIGCRVFKMFVSMQCRIWLLTSVPSMFVSMQCRIWLLTSVPSMFVSMQCRIWLLTSVPSIYCSKQTEHHPLKVIAVAQVGFFQSHLIGLSPELLSIGQLAYFCDFADMSRLIESPW